MSTNIIAGVIKAEREVPIFAVGDNVEISTRSPLGHYRVPRYIRGKSAVVEKVVRQKKSWVDSGSGNLPSE